MWHNSAIDRHYTGTFNISGEEINGELLYNKENGVIQLNLIKQVASIPEQRYGKLDIITGTLHSGTKVTLFHNRCIRNHVKLLQTQNLNFIADYLIFSKNDAANAEYNELVCVLEHALDWSGLSAINKIDNSTIKFENDKNKNIYHWFNAKITFSTSLKCELFDLPCKEESKVIERLVVHIATDTKQQIPHFTAIRNKVISLISFAIKDNRRL